MGAGFHEDNEINRLRSMLSDIADVVDDDSLTQAQLVAQIRQTLDLPETYASQAGGELPDEATAESAGKQHTQGTVWADGRFVLSGDYAPEGEPDMLVEVQAAEFPEVDAIRLAAAWNAAEGIPTDHLQPGAVRALVAALTMARGYIATDACECNGDGITCNRCSRLDHVMEALAPFVTQVPPAGGTTHDGESH